MESLGGSVRLLLICPSCGSTHVRKSEVNRWYDNVGTRVALTVTLRRPYRCLSCDYRFYDWRFARRDQSHASEEKRKAG